MASLISEWPYYPNGPTDLYHEPDERRRAEVFRDRGLQYADTSHGCGSPGSEFYVFDHQGNASDELDWTGDPLGISYSSAFGIGVSTLANDPYAGFGGQWGYYTDVETGASLLGLRYYVPSFGRFLTRDPIGYAGGINLYSYCANSPLTGIDPSGLTEGWDLVFLGADAAMIGRDIHSGASGWMTGLDTGALIVDSICALIPGVPAGLGRGGSALAHGGATALHAADTAHAMYAASEAARAAMKVTQAGGRMMAGSGGGSSCLSEGGG